MLKSLLRRTLTAILFICACGNTLAIDDLVYRCEMNDPELITGYVISDRVADGKIYLFGGWKDTGFVDTIQCYDLQNNTWPAVTAKLPYPFISNSTHGAAMASNGKFYIGPGNNWGGWGRNHRIIEFDPETGQCIERASITGGAYIWGIAVVPAPADIGGVYLFGGWNGSGINLIQHYDPETDTVRFVGTLHAGRTIGVILSDDEKVYLFGGNRYTPQVVEVFDFETESVELVPNPMGFGFNPGSDGWFGIDGNIYIWNPNHDSLGVGSDTIVKFNVNDWTFEDVGPQPYPYGFWVAAVPNYEEDTVLFFTRVLPGYIYGASSVVVPEVWELFLAGNCTFGPEEPITVTRGKGKPVVESFEWESCGGEGIMLIEADSLSSAWIYLNGEVVVQPNQVNPNITSIELPVTLLEGNNLLEVELAGAPGSQATIDFQPSE